MISVNDVVSSSFKATLRQICSVGRGLPQRTMLTLVRALSTSKVDYCNSLLAGPPSQLLDIAAATGVFSTRNSDHVYATFARPALVLAAGSTTDSIAFVRPCLYLCLQGSAPTFLAEPLRPPVIEVVHRGRLCSTTTSTLLVPITRRTSLGDRACTV